MIKFDISKIVIGIAGCGGLGSNAAQNLVRLGFSNFVLVDFDIIEESNLNRQFYFKDQIGLIKSYTLKENLLKINPNLNILTHNLFLHEGNIKNIFESCNYIIEGFDTVQSKKMLIELLANSKKIVAASGLGNGFDVENITTKVISESLTIIGDFKSDISKGIMPQSPGVQIAAAKQAAVILRYVTEDLC
ncbi:MAG: sulfur carrier protein ThiS adenylyltransferase ThiF [Spirochaetales bacterium]|nr:sulfur carrier protein ThiS adenylyltransferase ThiF [Spirochaetales bacterium]